MGVVTTGGQAVPVGNELDLKARDTEDNEDDGIRVNNDEGGSANVYVELTNRLQAKVKTTDATPTTLISFNIDLSDVNMYTFDFTVSAAAVFTTPVPDEVGGAGFKFFAAVVVDPDSGGTGTVIGTDTSVSFRSATATHDMSTVDLSFTVVGGTAFLLATGLAQDVYWNAVGYYTQMTDDTTEV